jgi:hypothetical protein
MKFVLLYETLGEVGQLTCGYFKKAAKKAKVGFYELDISKTDPKDLPNILKDGDLLYRIDTSKAAQAVEFLITRPTIATLQTLLTERSSIYNHRHVYREAHDIATPKTVYNTSKDREQLKKAVQYLGGFPVVIKVLGGSHSIGVMKIDSFGSLFSVVDYIVAQGDYFVLKEFINTRESARVIVLGGKAIGSIKYFGPKEDFRSTVGSHIKGKRFAFSEKIEQLAIDATRAAGTDFGGVDVIIKGGKGYVTEVNYPCAFAGVQKRTNIDVAYMIIEHLKEKSKRLQKMYSGK